MTTSSEHQPRTWVQKNLPEIGLGGVAIGNEFEYTSDNEAQQLFHKWFIILPNHAFPICYKIEINFTGIKEAL